LIPHAYRALLRDPRARRLLSGLGVSSLGDGMSIVTIAWLAVETAPDGQVGLFVGLAIAAYTLPGAVGALALSRYLRHRPARALVLGHCLLRAAFLGAIVVLAAAGALVPIAYVALLAVMPGPDHLVALDAGIRVDARLAGDPVHVAVRDLVALAAVAVVAPAVERALQLAVAHRAAVREVRAEVRAERVLEVEVAVLVAPEHQLPVPVRQWRHLAGLEIGGKGDLEPAEGRREREAARCHRRRF